MSIIWVVAGAAGIGLIAVIALLLGRARTSGTSYPDLGTVSTGWLADEKMGRTDRS